MKEFTTGMWTMIKVTIAYALALIGMVISIPAKLLADFGVGCCKLADKIIRDYRVDGTQIMSEIVDMDV